RAVHDHHTPRPKSGEHAAVAQKNIVDVGLVPDAQSHQIGGPPHGGGVRRDARSAGVGLHRRWTASPKRHLTAGVEHLINYSGSHASEADEADVHRRSMPHHVPARPRSSPDYFAVALLPAGAPGLVARHRGFTTSEARPKRAPPAAASR